MDDDPPTAKGSDNPEDPDNHSEDDGPEDPFAGLGGLGGSGDMGPEDPFAGLGGLGGPGGIPMMGEMLRMLQGTPLGGARQGREIARTVATGGESEANIDPAERIAIEQLVRVAELRVADATGLEPSRGTSLKVEVVNRTQWADRTFADYGELFEALGRSVGSGDEPADSEIGQHPMEAMLAGITRMVGPMMLALGTGALVGRLAQQALGGYMLPVPRPAGSPVLIALPNVDEFGREWSLDADDLRLWVCLHETVHHAVFAVDHVRERVNGLLLRHAAAFDSGPGRLEDLLGDFDPELGPEAWASLQSSLASPEALLGAVRSAEQEALLPELTALMAAITGYADHTMDRIGGELIGSYGRLTEALRRHRVEASASDRFVERILGLELDRDQYDRGAAFAAGVVERAGPAGLARLFSDPANLPTPNEVDAAGLWLARIDLHR